MNDEELIQVLREQTAPPPDRPGEAAAFERRVMQQVEGSNRSQVRFGALAAASLMAVGVATVVGLGLTQNMASTPAGEGGLPAEPPASLASFDPDATEPLTTRVDAAAGGVARGESGVRVAFAPGSLRRADGGALEGAVDLDWKLARDREALAAASMDLSTTVDGVQAPLQSFGMVQIEPTSDGAPVVFDGEAEVTFPLASGHGRSEGDVVGLYHYDEPGRTWTRESEGRVVAGRVVGRVRHFSWWSAAEPITDAGCVAGRVELPEGVSGRLVMQGTDRLTQSSADVGEGQFCLGTWPQEPSRLRVYLHGIEHRCFDPKTLTAEVTASPAGQGCGSAEPRCADVVLRPVEVPCGGARAEVHEDAGEADVEVPGVGTPLVVRGRRRNVPTAGAEPGLQIIRGTQATTFDPAQETTMVIDPELCSDLTALESMAMLGRLSWEAQSCLESRLRTAPDVDRERISGLLMADAWASGDKERWGELARRHLDEVSDDDTDVLYKYAIHLGRQGPERSEEAIHWADRALARRDLWSTNTHLSRSNALYKTRAAAAERLWRRAEMNLDGPASSRWRAATGRYAREWNTFAAVAGKDSGKALKLCVSATGNVAACR